MKRRARSPEEYDVTTGWRRFYLYLKRAGVTSAIKRGMRRRERREGKHAIRKGQS